MDMKLFIGAWVLVAIAVPLCAWYFEHVGNVRISERHHSRHDTFVIPVTFTRTLVFAMSFMGSFAAVVAVLMFHEVFDEDSLALLAFCDAVILTLYILWSLTRRYKVSTFKEVLVLRRFWGQEQWIRYQDITEMSWVGVTKGSGYRDLRICLADQQSVVISGMVDLERILMRINRFDVLAHTV